MNMDKLRGKMVERRISTDELADKIGISRASLYRKLKKPESITIGEAIRIKNIVALEDVDAIDIFLN